MIAGIDPGFSGAIALLHGERLTVLDLPIVKIRDKKQIDAKLFSRFIRTYAPSIKAAVIEDVHSMPGQGVSSTFRFGYNAGVLYGVLSANSIKTIKVAPAVWKSSFGLTRDKRKSLELARKLFPKYKEFFKLAKHDGRAEAALIALFGQQRIK